MFSRVYVLMILSLWIASTGWLVVTKVLPTIRNGTPPDYREILPKQAEKLPVVGWAIRWNERQIGWAENRVIRRIDGTGQVNSTVQFEDLPIEELVNDVFGALSGLIKPAFVADASAPLPLRVENSLWFDHYGTLQNFETSVDVGLEQDFLKVEGRVDGHSLELIARTQGHHQLYRTKIQLPPAGLVADTFSPRPRLGRLRVGQSWTFQSYRPFMPHSSMELINAVVERDEVIDWNGQLVQTYMVAYRRDAGSGLSAARGPVARLWVRRDGTVLRQDVSLANLRVQFVRLADDEMEDRRAWDGRTTGP